MSAIVQYFEHSLALPFFGIKMKTSLRWASNGCAGVAATAAAKSLQLCLTLCNPIDGSPPGSLVRGILQARVLEWGAIAFSGAGFSGHLTYWWKGQHSVIGFYHSHLCTVWTWVHYSPS